MNFVALDFETANPKRNSPCSIALTIVRNSQIVDQFYSLIKPQGDFFWRNTRVHGITAADVAKAPSFVELWPHIQGLFTPDNLIVAHNAPFDVSVLKATTNLYNIPEPHFLTLDTVKTSKFFFPDLPNHKLPTITKQLSIELTNHHNALDDCHACAAILLCQAQHFDPQIIQNFIKPA